jgi:hypothetical protein
MIVWNAKENGQPGQVKVVPWPPYNNWADRYDYDAGALLVIRAKGRPKKTRTKHVFDVFRLVVRDGIPIDEAHRAFMK